MKRQTVLISSALVGIIVALGAWLLRSNESPYIVAKAKGMGFSSGKDIDLAHRLRHTQDGKTKKHFTDAEIAEVKDTLPKIHWTGMNVYAMYLGRETDPATRAKIIKVFLPLADSPEEGKHLVLQSVLEDYAFDQSDHQVEALLQDSDPKVRTVAKEAIDLAKAAEEKS